MSIRTRDLLQMMILCGTILVILAVTLANALAADMYPNEVWPADATAETLNGTTDQTTGLDYIAEGVGPDSSPTLRVRYDRRLQRQNAILAAVNQGRVVSEGGLNFGIFPVTYYYQGTRQHFTGFSGLFTADNATNYAWVEGSTNSLGYGAAFPTDTTTFLPLAKLVAASGVVTITDERPAVLFHVPDNMTGAFAQSGLNSDITHLIGLTTAITPAQGGLGATNLTGILRGNGVNPVTGGNVDLASEVTGTLPVANGGTGSATASAARTALGAAASGANNDVTSLTGLTIPLSVVQGGTGFSTARVVPFAPTFVVGGTLSVKVYEIEFVAPVAFTIKTITGRVSTAPTGAALIVDVRDNGNSIFASQAEMVNIGNATNADTSATKNHVIDAGDIITVEVEQVGSTVAGADLTLVINARCDLQL